MYIEHIEFIIECTIFKILKYITRIGTISCRAKSTCAHILQRDSNRRLTTETRARLRGGGGAVHSRAVEPVCHSGHGVTTQAHAYNRPKRSDSNAMATSHPTGDPSLFARVTSPPRTHAHTLTWVTRQCRIDSSLTDVGQPADGVAATTDDSGVDSGSKFSWRAKLNAKLNSNKTQEVSQSQEQTGTTPSLMPDAAVVSQHADAVVPFCR